MIEKAVSAISRVHYSIISFFNTLSIEVRSRGESLPSYFNIRDFSIVDIAGLVVEGLNKPASCQFSIKHSPI